MKNVGTEALIEKDGKVLLILRNKKENDIHKGKMIGVGGHIEKDESPEQCIIREVKEETGLDVKDPKLKAVIHFHNPSDVPEWLVNFYHITDVEGELIPKEEQIEGDLIWVDKEKLLEQNIRKGDHIIFSHILNGEKVMKGKFVYRNSDELENYEIFE